MTPQAGEQHNSLQQHPKCNFFISLVSITNCVSKLHLIFETFTLTLDSFEFSAARPTEPANYRGSYTTGLIEIVVIEITMYRAAGTIPTTAIELLLVKLMLIRTTPLGQISAIALSRILRILI